VRIRIAFVFLILSASSHADGPTPIHGINEAGEEITVYEDGTVPTDEHGVILTELSKGVDHKKYPQSTEFSVSVYTVKVLKRNGTKEEYKLQDCGNDALRLDFSFSCRGGNSPLAGAKYEYVRELTKCGGSLMTCKTGCGPRAPREMIKAPWECVSGLEELGLVDRDVYACQAENTKTKGIIHGHEINLRERPDFAATVKSRLTDQTKLVILERNKECLNINGEKGQWVRVKVAGETEEKDGWVYDAYVEYVDKYPVTRIQWPWR
jgi:hypothetical protein